MSSRLHGLYRSTLNITCLTVLESDGSEASITPDDILTMHAALTHPRARVPHQSGAP